MRPLFSYLRTRMTATAVFAGPQDWGNGGGSPLSDRVDRAAGELAQLLSGPQPAQGLRKLESLPFEQLLGDISASR
jgi:FMN reductase